MSSDGGPQRNRRCLRHQRVFHAPREIVWGAWMEPDRIGKWWGPSGFTTTTYEMEVCPGGRWSYTMHGPDGRDYPNTIQFEEVIEPERLVYSQRGGQESDVVQFHVVVTFIEHEDGTEVTMVLEFPSIELRETAVRVYGAAEGGRQTLERLARIVEAAAAAEREG